MDNSTKWKPTPPLARQAWLPMEYRAGLDDLVDALDAAKAAQAAAFVAATNDISTGADYEAAIDAVIKARAACHTYMSQHEVYHRRANRQYC